MNNKTRIIAEAGVNHNGDFSLAKELVDIAREAGADIVKFQTFSAEEIVSKKAPQAKYQQKNIGKSQSQYEMIKNLELKKDDFVELYNYCNKTGITFLSTAFDIENLKFLVKECKIPLIKVPSGEITNAQFLYEIGKLQLPVILSTGMANIEEIKQAIAVLSYGWNNDSEPTRLKDCLDYYQTEQGKNVLNGNITILQCVTEYPAPYSDTNLMAMKTIKEKFGTAVGLSDHSLGVHIPVAAVSMGAKVIEKHFTIDKNLTGPDHKASLDPDELKLMVKYIRDVESAMGDGVKKPMESEIKNVAVARRSITVIKDIKKGEVFSSDNISCKRPGTGISPMRYWDILGEQSEKDFEIDDILEL